MTDNQESKELSMKERIEIFKESKFNKQSRDGYYWVVKLVYDLWQENQTYERKKNDVKEQLTTTQQALDAMEALWKDEIQVTRREQDRHQVTQQALDSAVEALKTAKRLLKHHHEIAKADIETYVKLDDGTFVPLNAQEGYAESGFWEETEAALAAIKE